MSLYTIDYSDYEAEAYLHNIERDAIGRGFEDVLVQARRVLDYLRRFERDFESMQRMLHDGSRNAYYLAEEARKNHEDPSPHEMLAAAMGAQRVRNESCMKDLQLAIRAMEDYVEAVNRARYWGDELTHNARIKTQNLIVSMENYAATAIDEPDLSHKTVKPIRKLTEGDA